jgi:hypothetical protein
LFRFFDSLSLASLANLGFSTLRVSEAHDAKNSDKNKDINSLVFMS